MANITDKMTIETFSSRYILTKTFVDAFGRICSANHVAFSSNVRFKRFPFPFGIIRGDFFCPKSLTTLENCPVRVEGDFYVKSLNCTSLEGGPEWVGKSYRAGCASTLKGIAKYIGGDFTRTKMMPNDPITIDEVMRLLFVTIKGHISAGHDIGWPVNKILLNGRDSSGKMPRELIPGKINELRDLVNS
jgi:hypothetical protein